MGQDGVIKRYFDAMEKEMRLRAASCQLASVSFDSIYIGGGTPSFVPLEYIGTLLESAFHLFDIQDKGLELSMECNPDSVTLDLVQALKDKGLNRVSLGVQSMDEQDLRTLGRVHGVKEVVEAVRDVREAGISNLSLDLIYSIPGQDEARVAYSLEKALGFKPEHVSCYELSFEDGTPMKRAVDRGEISVLDQETRLALTELVEETLLAHGYEQYEISNFSRPGFQCRHNIGYWTGRQYLGIGCSACSYLRGKRIRNVSSLDGYIRALQRGQLPVAEIEKLGSEARFREAFVMALRMNQGVDIDEFSNRFGLDCLKYYGQIISRMERDGLIRRFPENKRLALTKRGRYISNYVLSYFV